jgi:spermidine/putrescine transport system ATP-binding protein
LFPHLDVFKNIAFGLERRRVPRGEVERRVSEALEMARLQGLERRRISELSGGQQQRVALARAVVLRPRVLLLDEPLAALDLKLRKGMQVELKGLQRQLGVSFVYVTHDQEEALTMSDRVVVMNAGCVEQTGSSREIYEQPATEFVADFIGASNMIRGTLVSNNDHSSVVEIAGATVEVAGVCGEPGDSVRVMVRPEKVVFLPEGAAGTLNGKVEDGLYLGDCTRWRVRIADGQELTVHEQNRGPGHFERIGKSITMHWDPRSAVLFRG